MSGTWNDRPGRLPELGRLVLTHTAEILEAWLDLVRHRGGELGGLADGEKLLECAGNLLYEAGRSCIGTTEQEAIDERTSGEEFAKCGSPSREFDRFIRDDQLLYEATVITARKRLRRELTAYESDQLARFLRALNAKAIRRHYPSSESNLSVADSLNGGSDILDCCNDAVVQLNIDGTILRWNRGAERIYGWPAQRVLGDHVAIILPPDRRLEFDRCIAMLKQGRDVPPFDTVRRRADGSDVSVSISASPIRDSRGALQGYVSIARDISDRVRAAEALRDALEEAERASRAKSEFLANVSHELRTPMNAIIGMTELALDEELSPELRDYLETTRESADQLLALVNDVLDISKLEAGKTVLEEVNFSLREVVDETVRAISSRAYRKGLELAWRVCGDVPDGLHGDPLRLRQILTNLVGNAIKFTDEGEIVIQVRVAACSGRSCLLQFSVSDTGIGISEQDQHRVFAPFTQVDASSTRRFAGTGLGLAIASHLINCFHGEFWLESQVGSGSTFYFTARFALADQRVRPQQSPSQAVESLRNLPVLIADDNETNRQIMGKLLEEWEMVPVLASDANSALAKLDAAARSGSPIPIAVIDAIMPRHDGFELVDEIKERNGTKTVLMLSAADRLTFKDKCQETAYDAVLEKPISQSNLFDVIATTLGVASADSPRSGNLRGTNPPTRILNVLLAEDTPANRKVAERALDKRGHKVTAAANGREAFDLFTANPFDVVLMDVQMPSMDGFQATDAIRNYEEEHNVPQRVPIIAMTAHAMVGDRHRCLAAGMDDYISKPIDIRRLLELVESYGLQYADCTLNRTITNSRGVERGSAAMNPLETTDVMDLEKALRRLDGDRSLLLDLIGFFLEDYPALLARVTDGLAAGDAPSVERAAHSLKGLAANFDAATAQEIAQEVETRAKQGDLEDMGDLAEGLRVETRNLADQLERYREAIS